MEVWELYKQVRGISSLHALEWQRQCLEDERLVAKRENFIFWLPTGAGKTLVAEIMMIRETLIRRKNCILILPYVAIVQEKITSLASLERQLGVIVEEYAASKGRIPPIRRRNVNSIYVCTIEKGNSLVNCLIEKGRVDELGMVIVDELHMLGEAGGRGAVLEQCLCKLMFRPNARERVQVIGMSATLGNAQELCTFMDGANLFRTHFRPVKLVERFKLQNKLFVADEEGKWQLEMDLGGEAANKNLSKKDPDGIVLLLGNLLKGSVLIFCPTKQSCENLCKLLASLCPKNLREHRSAERETVLAQLREDQEGQLCPILSAGIRSGVTYHHSGLTSEERIIIESAYKNGVISVICCTSTLAAGVNLPARRVILRSPYVGREPLKKSQYLQMVGRAGRAGLDEKGDSITILKQGNEAESFKNMLEGPIDPCTSGLADELQREQFFLDLIVLKICSTLDELYQVLRQSLFGVQHADDEAELKGITERTIHSLVAKNMCTRPEVDVFCATKIGSATFNASLSPKMALDMNKDLGDNLSQGIVLSSHFHLLYNCVPLDVSVNVDWNVFHNEYVTLSKEERRLVHLLGFPESQIVQYLLSPNSQNKNFVKAMRLYVCFMLRQVWEQKPFWVVARHFGVPRGWLQSMLQSAVSQSSSIVRFSERTPELWALCYLLPEMLKRLSECAHQELVPLLGIECVKRARARQLFDRGYRTVGSIARAEPEQLMAALEGKLNRWQAKRICSSAKAIIRDQIAEKREELEDLGADEVPLTPVAFNGSHSASSRRAKENTPPSSLVNGSD